MTEFYIWKKGRVQAALVVTYLLGFGVGLFMGAVVWR